MKKNPKLEARRKKIPPEVKIFVDNSFAIAEQIDLILKKKGLSQKKFAKLLGKTESEISKWMSGIHNFTQMTLAKIQAVLGEPVTLCVKDSKKEYYLMFNTSHAVVVHPQVADSNKVVDVISGEENNLKLFKPIEKTIAVSASVSYCRMN
ncbi:MAG: helix-turn-helix transcriptional regulator [Bacteroidota bacterium]